MDVIELSLAISARFPAIKSGPLRLWGLPFGRPGEDWHTLVSCDARGDCLRLHFTDDEVLAVWNPSDVQIDASRFRVGCATEMRFTYYWGIQRTRENLRYRDYSLQNGLVVFRTNEDRVPGSGWLPEATVNASPAVDIGD